MTGSGGPVLVQDIAIIRSKDCQATEGTVAGYRRDTDAFVAFADGHAAAASAGDSTETSCTPISVGWPGPKGSRRPLVGGSSPCGAPSASVPGGKWLQGDLRATVLNGRTPLSTCLSAGPTSRWRVVNQEGRARLRPTSQERS